MFSDPQEKFRCFLNINLNINRAQGSPSDSGGPGAGGPETVVPLLTVPELLLTQEK